MKITVNIYLLLGIIFLSSCNSKNELEKRLFKYENDNKICDNLGKPIDSNIFYIPFRIFPDTLPNISHLPDSIGKKWESHLDSLDNRNFSKALFTLEEPVLTNKYLGVEEYRVTEAGSYDDNTVMRMVKSKNKVILHIKLFRKFTSSITDSIKKENFSEKPIYYSHAQTDSIQIIKRTKQLSIKDWNNFEKVVKSQKFLFMTPKVNMDFGPDGILWLVEMHSEKGFYAVKRSSYGKGTDKLEIICKAMFKLGGITFKSY